MRNLTFKGTHKDIGEQLGELYKSWGRTDFAMPPYGEEHFQEQLKIYEKWYPEHLELLMGIIKSMALDKTAGVKAMLTRFLT